jgi:hypothetical protein
VAARIGVIGGASACPEEVIDASFDLADTIITVRCPIRQGSPLLRGGVEGT